MNIYIHIIKVADLSMETKYYVYCVAEDDELMEGATTILPQPTSNNRATPMLTESTGRFTLDLTPPIINVRTIKSLSEQTSTVTMQLDEPGTAWCKAHKVCGRQGGGLGAGGCGWAWPGLWKSHIKG